MPTNTDLVKDLPADFEIFGQAVDTQMKTNADAAIAKSIVDAKGDIIAATAADTVSKLTVGANDTVLTADSTTATGLKWATPSSGGMTLLETLSISGSSVTSGTLSSAYKQFLIYITELYGTNEAGLRLRLNEDTANNYKYAFAEHGNGWSLDISDATSGIRIGTSNTDSTIRRTHNGIITITRPSDTNIVFVNTNSSFRNSSLSYQGIGNGVYDSSAAITKITIYPDAGTMTAGTAYIYGVN